LSKVELPESLFVQLDDLERSITSLERQFSLIKKQFDSPYLKVDFKHWTYTYAYDERHPNFFPYYVGILTGLPITLSPYHGGTADSWDDGLYGISVRFDVDLKRVWWQGALNAYLFDKLNIENLHYLFGPGQIPEIYRPKNKTRVVIGMEGNYFGTYDGFFDGWVNPDGSMEVNPAHKLRMSLDSASFTYGGNIDYRDSQALFEVLPRVPQVSYRIDM